ncbi:restriction endonuclease subunit S [Pseudoalteromonas nigrifaciens]|uniref:restriction endonuclease subunit S n=1 Tax=Pseudoalteromonas nigrifaciens TaxID=28109 RepID=UPI003FB90DB5
MALFNSVGLPNKWRNTSIFNLCTPKQWKTIPTAQLKSEGYVVYGANGKIGFYDTFTHEKPTLMITCRGATCGNIHLSEPNAYINGNAMALDNLTPLVDVNYLRYFLKRFDFKGVISGSAQPQITQKGMVGIDVALAPFPEQKRIVEKLDSLLAQVDTIQQRLNNLPDIIERFRQSVLAAAVSGKLTEQWRGANKIQAWSEIILKDAANIIDPQPSHRTPPVVEGGVPYIGIGDLMADGSINFERARKVSFDVLKEHNERYKLKEGDFLFGKIGTLGKATKLPMNIDYTLSANVILIQPLLDVVLPKFLTFFLSAPTTMNEVAKQSNSTSQAAFGIKKMRAFKCELPVLKEQTEIVRLVEQYFALADTLEKNLANAKQRVENLTQSILAKAFRGELVPQDPNDEPADKLLARIKAARLEAEKLGKAAKKAAKASNK